MFDVRNHGKAFCYHDGRPSLLDIRLSYPTKPWRPKCTYLRPFDAMEEEEEEGRATGASGDDGDAGSSVRKAKSMAFCTSFLGLNRPTRSEGLDGAKEFNNVIGTSGCIGTDFN